MTQEQFEKAESLLEQISKLNQLKIDIFKTYDKHRDDAELKGVLDKCLNVVDVLIEVDEKKFKEL